ncbi:MAG: glycine cleavage system protein GcvH [Actinobacteria bacterium]|nr:glycine cleavage system protein GcvH [Actinomycetota bacterium]
MYPEDLKYTKDHEWLRESGRQGRVGITDFAQHQLGDVVFVELPEVGRRLKAGEAFGVVESVKTVSDLYSPANGTVIEVNPKLLDHPELVNQDPYGEGWMIKLEVESPGDLMDAAAYQKLLQEDAH